MDNYPIVVATKSMFANIVWVKWHTTIVHFGDIIGKMVYWSMLLLSLAPFDKIKTNGLEDEKWIHECQLMK